MTRGYPIFQWRPGISIIEKYKHTLVSESDDEVELFDSSEDNNNSTKYE